MTLKKALIILLTLTSFSLNPIEEMGTPITQQTISEKMEEKSTTESNQEVVEIKDSIEESLTTEDNNSEQINKSADAKTFHLSDKNFEIQDTNELFQNYKEAAQEYLSHDKHKGDLLPLAPVCIYRVTVISIPQDIIKTLIDDIIKNGFTDIFHVSSYIEKYIKFTVSELPSTTYYEDYIDIFTEIEEKSKLKALSSDMSHASVIKHCYSFKLASLLESEIINNIDLLKSKLDNKDFVKVLQHIIGDSIELKKEIVEHPSLLDYFKRFHKDILFKENNQRIVKSRFAYYMFYNTQRDLYKDFTEIAKEYKYILEKPENEEYLDDMDKDVLIEINDFLASQES